jgi:flagellar hook-basal body complex protein FliE
MMQVKHGFSKGVIGRDMYSENTLKSMTKSELIELLMIAQHNYEVVLESYGNSVAYSEKLLKDRDNAIKDFAEKLKKKIHNLEYTTNLNRKTVPVEALMDQGNWILHDVVINVIDAMLKDGDKK